jgi:hypothetical protein
MVHGAANQFWYPGSCTSKHDTLYWRYAQKLDIRLSALLLLHQPGSDLLSAQQGNSDL